MAAAGLQLGMKVTTKSDFQQIRRRAREGMKKSLFSAAALVRTIARRSIRRRKKISPPGGPPHDHGGPLKRGILFDVNKLRQTAVIGPTKISSKQGDATSDLEFGGERTVLVGKKKKRRRLRVKPRPYMGPALKKAEPRLVKFWRGSLR